MDNTHTTSVHSAKAGRSSSWKKKRLWWIIIGSILLLIIIIALGKSGDDGGLKVAVEKTELHTITESVTASGKI